MRIGLMDSGLGGINVLKEFVKKYPNNYYVYFGDNKNLPYGDKKEEEIVSLANNNIKFLESFNLDMIIVACGTMSSQFDKLSSNIKLINIITPTKEYLKNSKYNRIGVIATKRSIESNAFLIDNKLVIQKAAIEFVPYIEKNIGDKETILHDNLDLFIDRIDCLILGCTHYPLLSEDIKEILNVDLIDMGKVIVDSLNLTNDSKQEINIYFSKLDENTKNNVNKILKGIDYNLEQKELN